jgi:hypothetical protein
MTEDFLSFHVNALNEVASFLGSQFTYNNTVYTGIINAVELSNELVDGGLMEVLGTQIIVPRAQLATAPAAGQTLYIGTQKARIVKVELDEVSFELTCVTATH